MSMVHTARGTGRIEETETVRGRTSHRVVGTGFNAWFPENKVHIASPEDGWMPIGDESDEYSDPYSEPGPVDPGGMPPADPAMGDPMTQGGGDFTDALGGLEQFAQTGEVPPEAMAQFSGSPDPETVLGYRLGGPGDNVDHDNSVRLPYNPDPQHDAVNAVDPDASWGPGEYTIDADERLHSSDSLTLNDVAESEAGPYPGPAPHLFAGAVHEGAGIMDLLNRLGEEDPNQYEVLDSGDWMSQHGDFDERLVDRDEANQMVNDHEFNRHTLPGLDRAAGKHHTYEDGGPFVSYDPALMGGSWDLDPFEREELEVRYNNPNKWRGRFDGDGAPGPFGGMGTVGDLAEHKRRRQGSAPVLGPKYVTPLLYTAVDHWNDPVQMFRDDPHVFIQRRGSSYSIDDGELDHYAALLDADRLIRQGSWRDVRQKAQRLRSEGKVTVKDISPDRIYASVQGDNGTYETLITKGSSLGGYDAYNTYGDQHVGNWHCSCKWGNWAFKRRFTFIGRLCSHGLASYWEMQAAHHNEDAAKGRDPRRERLRTRSGYTRQAASPDHGLDYLIDHYGPHDKFDPEDEFDRRTQETQDYAQRSDQPGDADDVPLGLLVLRQADFLRTQPRGLTPELHHIPKKREQHFEGVDDLKDIDMPGASEEGTLPASEAAATNRDREAARILGRRIVAWIADEVLPDFEEWYAQNHGRQLDQARPTEATSAAADYASERGLDQATTEMLQEFINQQFGPEDLHDDGSEEAPEIKHFEMAAGRYLLAATRHLADGLNGDPYSFIPGQSGHLGPESPSVSAAGAGLGVPPTPKAAPSTSRDPGAGWGGIGWGMGGPGTPPLPMVPPGSTEVDAQHPADAGQAPAGGTPGTKAPGGVDPTGVSHPPAQFNNTPAVGTPGGSSPITPGAYQIQKGDTLSDIAQRSGYGGNYQDLAKANNIADPDKIFAGDTINIGSPGGDTPHQGTGAPPGPAAPGGDTAGAGTGWQGGQITPDTPATPTSTTPSSPGMIGPGGGPAATPTTPPSDDSSKDKTGNRHVLASDEALLNHLRELSTEPADDHGHMDARNDDVRKTVDELRDRGYDASQLVAMVRTADSGMLTAQPDASKDPTPSTEGELGGTGESLPGGSQTAPPPASNAQTTDDQAPAAGAGSPATGGIGPDFMNSFGDIASGVGSGIGSAMSGLSGLGGLSGLLSGGGGLSGLASGLGGILGAHFGDGDDDDTPLLGEEGLDFNTAPGGFAGSGPDHQHWTSSSEDYIDKHEKQYHEEVGSFNDDDNITKYSSWDAAWKQAMAREANAFDQYADWAYATSDGSANPDDWDSVEKFIGEAEDRMRTPQDSAPARQVIEDHLNFTAAMDHITQRGYRAMMGVAGGQAGYFGVGAQPHMPSADGLSHSNGAPNLRAVTKPKKVNPPVPPNLMPQQPGQPQLAKPVAPRVAPGGGFAPQQPTGPLGKPKRTTGGISRQTAQLQSGTIAPVFGQMGSTVGFDPGPQMPQQVFAAQQQQYGAPPPMSPDQHLGGFGWDPLPGQDGAPNEMVAAQQGPLDTFGAHRFSAHLSSMQPQYVEHNQQAAAAMGEYRTPHLGSYGRTDDSSDVVRQFQAAMGGGDWQTGYTPTGVPPRDYDLSAGANQFLSRTAGRTFSLADQARLEQESHVLGARNLDELDLTNTHYMDGA